MNQQNPVTPITCFYLPEEENGCLSNWYLSAFTVDGVRFSSMEQFLMYQKAVICRDAASARKILASDDPAVVKKLGRLVSPYDGALWAGMRQVVAYRGLYAKFSQNADLKAVLLATGDSILAECSATDTIWGIGCAMTDPGRLVRSRWAGENILGYALMQVRQALRSEASGI